MRAVTVFLSCPGDLITAKDELAATVHEVSNLFRRFDVYVAPWRHDPQAIPGVGNDAQEVVTRQLPEYDVYVGMLCARLGTPTQRGASGTMEEFFDARDRYINTGRPEILFYCCTEPPPVENADEQEQRDKVAEFRRSYPGLFSTFQSISELRSRFKDHLIDVLLRDMHCPVAAPRPWLPQLAATVDATICCFSYLDRSSAFAERVVEKLRGVTDLPGTLHPNELDALVAATHLRALQSRNQPIEPARRVLRQVSSAPWLEPAAIEIVALAAEALDTNNRPEMRVGEVRCHFVAALLQLGELLDLDHEAIKGVAGFMQPTHDADISCWLAYHTRRIVVERPGIVDFRLLIARPQEGSSAAEALARCATLTFELAWQRLRGVLTANCISVSRVPVTIAASALVEPLPMEIEARLVHDAEEAYSALPELLHLSEDLNMWPGVDELLPLPRSAILHELRVHWQAGRICSIRVWSPDGVELQVSAGATDIGEAVLPVALLTPFGDVYRWELVDESAGFPEVIARGDTWALPQSHQHLFDLAISANDDARKNVWRSALGLWNDLIAELWPRLAAGMGSPGEARLVRDVLLYCYEWLVLHSPDSGRIDTIRNATQALNSFYLKNGESP